MMYVKRVVDHWLMCDARHVDSYRVTPDAIIAPGELHLFREKPHSVRHLGCVEEPVNNSLSPVGTENDRG